MNKQETTFDSSLDPIISSLFEDTPPEFENDLIESDLRQASKGRHIQTFSARVLDWDKHSVKTEWLVNREEGKYQVRHFPIELFKNTNFLMHGHRLMVFLFVKSGEMKISFEDGSKHVSEKDFPDSNILKDLNSQLFKFK